MTGETVQAHATCVAVDGAGVLLLGAPGSGKSDLALRLIEGGAELVADDRVDIALEAGRLIARAPAPIKGLIEARGVGVVPVPHCEQAPLALAIDLVALEAVERMPEPENREYLGVPLPLVRLAPFEASAPMKVRLAVQALTGQ